MLEELESVLKDMNKGFYHRKMIDEKMLEENDWRLGKCEIAKVDDFIEFENVPIIAPNGDLILKRPLSFKIEKGDHLMVLGPNGSGKSSAFRILRGLWPIFGGKLSCPSNESVAFLSQRPYLTVGTLRDQVIYPQTKGKFRANGGNDDELGSFMDNVKLQHILERHVLYRILYY